MVAVEVTPETPPTPACPSRPSRGAVVAGTAACLLIVLLSGAIMLAWQGGGVEDCLLGAAVLGLLLRLPHTVPVWSGLSLLAVTALAVVLGDQVLAERTANLTYYGLGVGCLWLLWDRIVERLNLWLPAPALIATLRASAQPRAPLARHLGTVPHASSYER